MKMKTITCKQIGGQTCTYAAESETEEELKTKIMAHLEGSHKKKLASMTPEQLADMHKEIDELIT